MTENVNWNLPFLRGYFARAIILTTFRDHSDLRLSCFSLSLSITMSDKETLPYPQFPVLSWPSILKLSIFQRQFHGSALVLHRPWRRQSPPRRIYHTLLHLLFLPFAFLLFHSEFLYIHLREQPSTPLSSASFRKRSTSSLFDEITVISSYSLSGCHLALTAFILLGGHCGLQGGLTILYCVCYLYYCAIIAPYMYYFLFSPVRWLGVSKGAVLSSFFDLTRAWLGLVRLVMFCGGDLEALEDLTLFQACMLQK